MSKIIIFYLLLILLSSQKICANEGSSFISFGHVDLADSRIPLDIKDFRIRRNKKSKKVKVGFIKGEVQWVRTSKNLLAPRARFGIKIISSQNIFIKYLDKTLIPIRKNGYQYIELYTNLFNPEAVNIFINGKHEESLIAYSKKNIQKKETQLIDYSCVKYSLQITGLDNEYLSVGCKMDKTGPFGNEKPRLEVSFITTNYHLKNASAPYTSFITSNHPVKIKLYNNKNQTRDITITTKIPKKLPRLKTALGFGPYTLKAIKDGKENQNNSNFLNPAAMIYAKWDLTRNTSLRAFDALVVNDSLFNNFGLYYAYELATMMDGRISIVPLLGAQGLSYKFNKNDKVLHNFIYPQGVEINFSHAFGFENYTFVYGMFLSTSSNLDYKNLWVRYGKGYFLELNYIKWGEKQRESTMMGLSVGIPFMTFW